jgi:thiol-disulfide isomerase/thioredoxin
MKSSALDDDWAIPERIFDRLLYRLDRNNAPAESRPVKPCIWFFALFSSVLFAQKRVSAPENPAKNGVLERAESAPSLSNGSPVSWEILATMNWIQGEIPKSFEPGKIYLFECWATWCGPCVASIPHMNALHRKFHEKGLRVYGMNVREGDAEVVRKFVKAKGDGMSYPVAFAGEDSSFEDKWFKLGGVRGIPHTFVVKDGKLLFSAHPSELTDSVIEALLVGGEPSRGITGSRTTGEKFLNQGQSGGTRSARIR